MVALNELRRHCERPLDERTLEYDIDLVNSCIKKRLDDLLMTYHSAIRTGVGHGISMGAALTKAEGARHRRSMALDDKSKIRHADCDDILQELMKIVKKYLQTVD